MSSYYSESPSGVDLMLQDVILSINSNSNIEQNSFNAPKDVLSPSGSSESKKTISFENNDIFNLYDINISIPKVIIKNN